MNEALKPKDIPFIRSANNYDAKLVSDQTGLGPFEETLTQQQFKDDADPNAIAARFGLTDSIPPADFAVAAEKVNAMFGDFTGKLDFQTAQDMIVEARQAFMTLPARIRSRFDNSPQKLLAFLEDPENRDEAERLKLVNPRQVATDTSGLATGNATPGGKGSPSSDPSAPAKNEPKDKTKDT